METTGNKILIGSINYPILTLTDECIKSISGLLSCNLIADELPDDTVEVVFDSSSHLTPVIPLDSADGMMSENGDILLTEDNIAAFVMQLPRGLSLWWYIDDKCIGEFYLKEITRTSRTQFALTAQSIMGLLDTHTYYGKICNGDLCKDVVKSIFLSNGLVRDTTAAIADTYSRLRWGPEIDSIPIYGWIPVSTKRDALHQLFFAYGLNFVRSDSGEMMVTYIFDAPSTQIADAKIYSGGSVTIPDLATRIEIDEHGFHPDLAEYEEVFNNKEQTYPSGEYIITFDKAPLQRLYAESGTIKIVKWCPNAAIVTGSGVLKGQPYTHTTRTLVKGSEDGVNGKTIKIDSVYMVTANTSFYLLDTLWSYYAKRKEIEFDVVYSGETLGSNYKFLNPYREIEQGVLSEIKLDASATTRCAAKFVAGYRVSAGDWRLTKRVVLTGTGSWTVPESVFQKSTPRIIVLLIGGGSGGASGLKGQNGKSQTMSSRFTGSKNVGGSDGEPGDGGKILQIVINGDNLQRTYAYQCGTGGHGGDICFSDTNANIGTPGSDTTFGVYSSANGTRSVSGIKDYYSGTTYAAKPERLIGSGGSSGYTQEINGRNLMLRAGNTVAIHNRSMTFFSGGTLKPDIERFSYADSTRWAEADTTWGFPGGAGVGESGGDPTAPTMTDSGTIVTGGGGNGGNATIKPDPEIVLSEGHYGWGGWGGYGGGAGGDTGVAATVWPFGVIAGTPGAGGNGGPGGDGSPGAVIVYF